VFFKSKKHLTHGVTSPAADIMRKYKLFGVRSPEKFIPEELLFLPFYETCQLLKALFSGDGCAYYQEKNGRKSLKISYSSASKQLIDGIQSLLASVGIISFVTKLKRDKHTWYNLYIAGKSNIKIFIENIGFFNDRKQQIMMNGWERSRNNLAGWNTYDFSENRDLCFMPIDSIKKAEIEDVYDMSVSEGHCFVANGILVHNSIEQDADNVILLHAEEEDLMTKGTFELKVIIAKQRNGQVGYCYLNFYKNTLKIFNQERNRK
jgi:replicative DNA helicase